MLGWLANIKYNKVQSCGVVNSDRDGESYSGCSATYKELHSAALCVMVRAQAMNSQGRGVYGGGGGVVTSTSHYLKMQLTNSSGGMGIYDEFTGKKMIQRNCGWPFYGVSPNAPWKLNWPAADIHNHGHSIWGKCGWKTPPLNYNH